MFATELVPTIRLTGFCLVLGPLIGLQIVDVRSKQPSLHTHTHASCSHHTLLYEPHSWASTSPTTKRCCARGTATWTTYR